MTTDRARDSAADALTRRYLIDHPAEAALRLETIDPQDAADIVVSVPVALMVPVWRALASGAASAIFTRINDAGRRALLEALDRNDAVAILGLMATEERETQIAALSDEIAEDIRMMLSYPDDTAGRLMDTKFFALHGSISVRQALEMLRRRQGGRISFIKLVDEQNRLSRLVDLRDLALAPEDATLEKISVPVPQVVLPTDPRDVVVEKFEETDLQELPVVDLDGRVVGIIRHAQLVDALRDTVSVDMQTMVGASKDERALSSSWFAIRKRMPWLQVNLLTAFLAASVVGLFEDTIAKFTALAILLPVVAGQSGNAGAQALADHAGSCAA